MGWECLKDGDGFFLNEQGLKGRNIRFANEADSHAAGEAVRLYLGRPRVSEIIAQKEKVEAELRDLRDLQLRQAAEVKAANQRALDFEVGFPDRLPLAQELTALRTEVSAVKAELRDLKHPHPPAATEPTVEQLKARIAYLEGEVAELTGKVPSAEAGP